MSTSAYCLRNRKSAVCLNLRNTERVSLQDLTVDATSLKVFVKLRAELLYKQNFYQLCIVQPDFHTKILKFVIAICEVEISTDVFFFNICC